jgi:hypothetical protein
MKTERFINSKFYSLKEVKRYNDFLTTLQSKNSNVSKLELDNVVNSLVVHRPYEDLSKFVEDSDKYNILFKEKEDYDVAQNYLKSINHKRVEIVSEVYPNYVQIYQHTITVEKTKYDYELEESYKDICEEIFFTCRDKIVFSFDEFILPYVCTAFFEPKDLVNEAIEQIDVLTNLVLAHRMSERLNVSISDLESVFDLRKLHHYTNYVNYEDRDYYNNEVKSLIILSKEARSKEYIKEDKYVEYPWNTPYLSFLKLLESNEYKNYEQK